MDDRAVSDGFRTARNRNEVDLTLDIFEISPITEEDEQSISYDISFFLHALEFVYCYPQIIRKIHPELVEFKTDVESMGGEL